MARIQAKDTQIGQIIFWHRLPAMVTCKSPASSTIEVTFVYAPNAGAMSQTREINYAEYVAVLDADFYNGEECIYRTFGAQEDKESEEKRREALREQAIADKMAYAEEQQAIEDRNQNQKMRELADIFSVSKNPFLSKHLGVPLNSTTIQWIKEMENSLRLPRRKPTEDDDGS